MAVRLFYEDDEFSTMHPANKVSVRDEDGRVHRQKQLLLMNLKELHL